MLLHTAKRREIQIFVKPVKLAVLDMHRDTYWYRNLRPRCGRSRDGAVLRHDAPMKVLNAYLLFAGEQIRQLHVKILCVDPAGHGLLRGLPDLLNSSEVFTSRHEGPHGILVDELHEPIEVVAEVDLFELLGEAFRCGIWIRLHFSHWIHVSHFLFILSGQTILDRLDSGTGFGFVLGSVTGFMSVFAVAF